MDDIDRRLAEMEPVEATSFSAIPLVHSIMQSQVLSRYDSFENRVAFCAELPRNINRVDVRLRDKEVWKTLCLANDYAVVVSGYVAENYVDIALIVGWQVYRTILMAIDPMAYLESLKSGDASACELDAGMLTEKWSDVSAHLKNMRHMDTDRLRIEIKKEFQRATKGHLPRDADTRNKFPASLPDNPDVRDLCHRLGKGRDRISAGAVSEIGIAREFTGEAPGNDKKARSLLRQARRFTHLWKRADS